MKEPKKLLVTFDYELFLGRNSGSVANCIIKPTNNVLKILDQYKISAIFFVDTVYLLRLREKSAEFDAARKDYDAIIEQLKALVKCGHYLFPHIHAHWRDAIYDRALNTWQLNDLSNYRFHSLNDAEKDRIFKDSLDFLNGIILPLWPGYAIDSYRAGGWCIQPFSDFKPYFEKYNIINDFSVTPGIKSVSERNYHDFTNVKRNVYFFKDDVLKDGAGPFCEFPVSVMQPTAFEKLVGRIESKILWFLKVKNSGDGHAAQFSRASVKHYVHQVLSIDNMLLSKMWRYKAFVKQNNYIHFVSHPKMLSLYNIKLFGLLLKYIYSKNTVISDYQKMKHNYVAQNINTHRHKAEFH